MCVCRIPFINAQSAADTHHTTTNLPPSTPYATWASYPVPRRIAEQLRGALRKGLRSGGKRGRRVDQNRGHVNGRVELTHVRGAG